MTKAAEELINEIFGLKAEISDIEKRICDECEGEGNVPVPAHGYEINQPTTICKQCRGTGIKL